MDYENQQMLEHLFNDRQARPLILKELASNQIVQAEITQAIKLSEGFLTKEFIEDVLIQLILAKRTTVPALVGMFRFHFANHFDSHQLAAMGFAGMIALRLVGFDDARMQLVVKYDVSEKTHDLIRQYMYLPPMIIPPLPVRDGSNNRGSGYITQPGDSLLLQDNHHEGELCVEHLNTCNQVQLTINDRVVKSLRNHWKNVEAPKPDETFEDYQKRIKAFEKYEKDSFLVMALMIEMGNVFYLTHKYDKRGRTYCQGYQVNYQGNTWNKAVVELANKEMVQ